MTISSNPLLAAWNAIITWRIMIKAREQALGPFAIEAMIGRLEQEPLSERAQRVALHTVGALIMANQDAHPNHVYLLSRLLDTFQHQQHAIDVDWPGQRFALSRLERSERFRVLELSIAAADVEAESLATSVVEVRPASTSRQGTMLTGDLEQVVAALAAALEERGVLR